MVWDRPRLLAGGDVARAPRADRVAGGPAALGTAVGDSGETEGYAFGLVTSILLGLAGLLLTRVPARVPRGIGVGIVTGSVVTALGWFVVLVS